MNRSTMNFPVRIAILLLVPALCAFGSPGVPMQDEPLPPGRLGENVTPLSYDLDLVIQPEQDGFSGTTRIAIDIARPARKIWLHGSDLDVDKVVFVQDGVESEGRYRQENDTGVSSVRFAEAHAGRGELVFRYRAPFHQASALYSLEEGGDHYVFSQLEAIHARGVFPGFDEPRFKTGFKVSVTTAADNKVVFNSPQLRSERLADGNVKHTFAETRPLPTYLLAFAVGPFDINQAASLPKTALRQREVPLRAITVKGKGSKADYALEQTAGMLETLEAYFGMPYPYAKLDLIASPGNIGAMENPGAIVYPELVLFVDGSSAPDWLRRASYIQAHELAHQWFGNLVTPEWWEDIWLNEAFATWMGAKTVEHLRPELGMAIDQQKSGLDAIGEDSSPASRQIQQPIHDNALIRNAFDEITYEKGAAVLRMVETLVGEEAFRAGVRHHLRRFPHATASSTDFFDSMAAGSGDARIRQILQSFVSEVGAPQVDVAVTCADDGARMRVSQSRYRPLGMDYPVDTAWQLPFCYRTGTGRHCELVAAAEANLPLPSCPAWLLPNANGDGYYRWNLDKESWGKLVRHREQLSAAELVSLADAAMSAYTAGNLDSATMLELTAMLGRHDDYEVSSLAGGFLSFMRHALLGGEHTADYRRFVESIYGPRLASLGYEFSSSDSPSTRQDRRNTLANLALGAQSPEARAYLARMGSEYLQAVESGADTASVPDDLVMSALGTLVEGGDTATLHRLEATALASTDAISRTRALVALGRAKDPAYLDHVYEELLPDEDLSARDRTQLLGTLSWDTPVEVRNFRWLIDHLDLVMEGMPSLMRNRITMFAEAFCEAEDRKLVADFLATAEKKFPGLAAPGRNSLATIDRCIAIRSLKSEEFRTALAAVVPAPVDVRVAPRADGKRPARQEDIEAKGTTP